MQAKSVPVFPTEITDIIVESLSYSDYYGLPSIKSCALASHFFVPLCQKHIFKAIKINYLLVNGKRSPSAEDFIELMTDNASIADYVHSLSYRFGSEDAFIAPALSDTLMSLKKLQSLTVGYEAAGYQPDLDWQTMELRAAFQHLLNLPTLTQLTLHDKNQNHINNFPLSDLTLASNVDDFGIGHMDFNSGDDDFQLAIAAPLSLKRLRLGCRSEGATKTLLSATLPNGDPVVDLKGLTHLSVHFSVENRQQDIKAIYERVTQLAHLKIELYVSHMWLSYIPRPIKLFDSILKPLSKTLKALELCFGTYGGAEQPLEGIAVELEKLQGDNAIETIILVYDSLESMFSTTAGNWSRLDQVLTDPGWPSLVEVTLSIDIRVVRHYCKKGGFEENVRKMVAVEFSRLRMSKAIRFDFVYIDESNA